jgi:hypothetical protein
VVMDICKNYFEYKCSTMCGFPEITLEVRGHQRERLSSRALRSASTPRM